MNNVRESYIVVAAMPLGDTQGQTYAWASPRLMQDVPDLLDNLAHDIAHKTYGKRTNGYAKMLANLQRELAEKSRAYNALAAKMRKAKRGGGGSDLEDQAEEGNAGGNGSEDENADSEGGSGGQGSENGGAGTDEDGSEQDVSGDEASEGEPENADDDGSGNGGSEDERPVTDENGSGDDGSIDVGSIGGDSEDDD